MMAWRGACDGEPRVVGLETRVADFRPEGGERTPAGTCCSAVGAAHPHPAIPAAVDVVDLVVGVECHGLHAVREGPVQDPDTWAVKAASAP